MKFTYALSLSLLSCSALYADNLLHPGTPILDRPTLTTLGVQLPLTGDDNFNATVAVQYRVSGTATWQTGLPLFRVHPETVAGYTVAPQFGGSIFDLRPATTYDIQLHVVDPDGVDQTFNLTGTTRPVPADPITPNVRNVSDVSSLIAALNTAAPGDVITLANGFYPVQFLSISAAGTPTNPIVIRGASEDGVILDGGNCDACNVVEVYGGGYVHIERMTIQNGLRAIRFQQEGAAANVVRRVHVKNVQWGITGRNNQTDMYIADNIVEGRLAWPLTNDSDGGVHASDDGIAVYGFGHVVAHNQISGFGDAMKTEQDGARAADFYGNDIVFTYDNGIELDASEGNVRCFRNRFMNNYTPISVQPIHGGPAYIFRNVVVNVAGEQLKFHALAVTPQQEPSGVLVYHNTFLAPASTTDLNMQTPAASHYFEIANNLFLAAPDTAPVAVNWTGPIDHGTFDYNGYFPDGIFAFNNPLYGGYFLKFGFASLQALGMEQHGVLATGPIFASGLTAPASYTIQMPPADATLAAGSIALDRGRVLSNINDNYQGSGPDLGALELGCPAPSYGPRPEGTDETNEIVGCSTTAVGPGSVSVAPSTVTVGRSQSQLFTATSVPVGGALTWKISPLRGTVTAGGLYTAPADALMGETVTVTAASAANAAVSGSGVVHLTAPVTIALGPGSATVAGSATQQFTATVSGAATTSVSWILAPSIGSITPAGLFTAPPATSTAQTITITAVSTADSTKTASATITVPATTAAGTGQLQGTASSLTSVSLTAEGTIDWAHWGDPVVNRKASGGSMLGDVTPITNGNPVYPYNNDLRAFDWSDGAPTASSSGNKNGLYINGTGNGFSLTVPASSSTRVLRVHVGGWYSSGRLVATLSNGTAPFIEDVPFTGVQYTRDYVLTYSSAQAGQTLNVKWTMTSGAGNVTWNAASVASAVTATVSGQLQGAASSLSSASLTTEGTIDWAHWGDPVVNRKASGASVLGDLTPITNGNAVYPYNNDPRAVDWSDGAPTASSSGNRNGVFINSTGNGFSLTVPATAASRVLRVHVGGWYSSARLVATLSDGTAAPFTEDVAYTGGQYDRDYVLTYSSTLPGQSLNVRWTMTGGSGNVTWNAASLAPTGAPTVSGQLRAAASAMTSVSLTSEGTIDWAHWGDPVVNRKASGSSLLGNLNLVTNGNAAYPYNNDPRAFDWSDGAPTASNSGNRNGIYINSTGNGFSLTVPAAAAARVLRVHVGGWYSSARLVATLSDGSAAPFTEDVAYTGGQYVRDYALTYGSTLPGQTLTVTWIMTSGPGNGNVTFDAASVGAN
jgi:hypothetical protein